uniref:Uncharacterized protein n=1 Tax=Meloidogyne enterolobii TaxID=390850 RepID=A0A6V7W210_MELEN|nr:unnamed protein product [Meloidogyne enterolobii]
MAEYMNIKINKRKRKGEYFNLIAEFQALFPDSKNRELLKRFRFNEEAISYICSIIEDDIVPYSQKGNPVPLPIQVCFWNQNIIVGRFWLPTQALASCSIQKSFVSSSK